MVWQTKQNSNRTTKVGVRVATWMKIGLVANERCATDRERQLCHVQKAAYVEKSYSWDDMRQVSVGQRLGGEQ